MKRKLVKQGASTLMVSLPAKWTKRFGLGKGDEVDLAEHEERLIITSEPMASTVKRTELSLYGKTESSIRTQVTNTYRAGYDRIMVTFEHEEQYLLIAEIVKDKLIGMDVQRKDKGCCIIESITEPAPDQFENILLKIFYNIQALFDITKERFAGKDPAEEYTDVEQRIMSYESFCKRAIAKRKVVDAKSEFVWTFLTLINHGQRELYHVHRFYEGGKASSEVQGLLASAEELFHLVRDAYVKQTIAPLAKVHELEKVVTYQQGHGLLQKNKREAIVIFHVLLCAKEFYQANSPLAGMII